MKILHAIPLLRLDQGGPVRAVIDLSNALVLRGHDVQILSFDFSDAPPDWTEHRTHRLEPLGPRLIGRASAKSVEAIIRESDVLHFHGIWEPFYLQLGAVARRAGRPYVISVRGMLDDWSMRQSVWKKRLYLRAGGAAWLRQAAAVHLTAHAELEQAEKYFTPAPGVVVPNLLDLEPYREPPSPEPARAAYEPLRRGEPTVLFMSRLHEKKGLEHLIDAARILRDRGVACQTLIAGSGEPSYEALLRRRTQQAGLGDRLHFLGQVSGPLKVSLYNACDLLCLPTSQENFGFVYYEALAAGTPILTTTGTDTWSELRASGAAEILDLAELSESLPDALTGLLADPERLRERGRRGRAWVFERLAPEQVVRRFEALYRTATNRATTSPGTGGPSTRSASADAEAAAR